MKNNHKFNRNTCKIFETEEIYGSHKTRKMFKMDKIIDKDNKIIEDINKLKNYKLQEKENEHNYWENYYNSKEYLDGCELRQLYIDLNIRDNDDGRYTNIIKRVRASSEELDEIKKYEELEDKKFVRNPKFCCLYRNGEPLYWMLFNKQTKKFVCVRFLPCSWCTYGEVSCVGPCLSGLYCGCQDYKDDHDY
jgi:hypothetical protein